MTGTACQRNAALLDPDLRPMFHETVAFEEAQARLAEAELSDGLPLVPPTEQRIAAMLGGLADPDTARDLMPPLFGELTPRDIAYQCVLAGCRPGVVPLVLSAALATLAPEFNLLGLATTTGSAAVGLIVHGAAVHTYGVSGGINCLGPGHMPNATIGRAISLVLRNIGGARAGTGDMATVGQPGKYTFCFAESDDGLLPSLPERRGIRGAAGEVTVLGFSGTAEVLPDQDRSTPEAILDPLATIMRASNATTGAARRIPAPDQVFILPPELAQVVLSAGWGLKQIQGYLHARDVAPSPESIHPIVAGGAGVKMAYIPMWGGDSRPVTRAISG
jgi:hypothetical protein